MSRPTIIEASDLACASAAADLFGGNGLNTNQQVALVANLFAEHRAKVETKLNDALVEVERLRRAVHGYQNGLATGLVAIDEKEYTKLKNAQAELYRYHQCIERGETPPP